MEEIGFISNSFGKMNGLLTFFIIIFIILAYVSIKFKDTIVLIFTEEKDKRKIKDLKTHSMFLTCDKVLDRIDKIDFTTFNCYDEVKTSLLKKLIHYKIDIVKLRFTELLEHDKIDTMTEAELKFLVATTLSNLVNEYNNNALRYMVDEMNIEIKDAKFLIDKYEEFREYIVNAFVTELDTIVLDSNYNNNFDRVNTILYTVSISLGIIPRDVVATFNGVNGRFKKVA